MAIATVDAASLKFALGMLKIQHTYDMTTYPNIIDGYATLPTVSGSTQEDIAINDLRAATLAIETELGVTPRGVYSDTRARLDILESRISYAISPTIISDGYLVSPLYLYNVPSVVTLSISDGYGIPSENRVDGSLFMRADGAANSDLYVRRAGAWKAIQTDLFTAAGDLSGTYLTQNVIGLQGKSLNSSLASIGATQDGYVLNWDNADGYWRASYAGALLGTLGGDLRGSFPNPTVASLTGVAGVITIPAATSFALGTTPATTGLIRVPNNIGSILSVRDNLNTTDWSVAGTSGVGTFVFGNSNMDVAYNGFSVAFNTGASNTFIFGDTLSNNRMIFTYPAGNAAQKFGSTNINVLISQTDTAINSATGAPFTIQAQNATGTTSIGGDLILKPGTGTSSNGSVKLGTGTIATTGTLRTAHGFSLVSVGAGAQDMPLIGVDLATNNITIGSQSAGIATIDIDAGTGGGMRFFTNSLQIYGAASGQDYWTETYTLAHTKSYATALTSITISQADRVTNNATGATLTIQAQNSTVGTTVGGSLVLAAGTGTTNGHIDLVNVATTATPPAAGGAALPATALGFVTIYINGVARQIAYY